MLKVKVNQLKEKLELEPTEEEEEESETTTPTTGTEVDPEIPEEVNPTSESSSTEGVMGEEEVEEPEEKISFREKVRRKFGRLSRLFKLKRRLMKNGKQTLQPSGP